MDFQQAAKAMVAKMTIEEKMMQMHYESPAIERLGVLAHNWWNECLHGLARNGSATVFPQSIAMAASFNTDLMQEVATAISEEIRARYNESVKFGDTQSYQGLTMCSPNINIFRDPRWGRGQETYGEDPYLTGTIASAYIRGLQGEGKYRKADATLKHYAVHSGPEAARHGFNAVVSQRDLYETYLWAFKYCIDHADPSAVMGAYNAVNGEPASGSVTLLQKILVEEFGFTGYVESDAGSITDIHAGHHYTANEIESAALALKCGCHLNIGDSFKHLPEALRQSLITEEDITAAVEKLFTARFRLGMFSDDCEYDRIPYDVIECDKHIGLSRTMSQESIVLVKNDGILPLHNTRTIAVIGPNADDVSVLLGNYEGRPSRYTTLLRGIQDGCDAKVIYAKGCKVYQEPNRNSEKFLREAIVAAQKADVVILCMGLNPQMEQEEAKDNTWGAHGDKIDLELPGVQRELLAEISKVGKPMVFVNTSGSCVSLCEADEKCNAVVQCFYPGAEGGSALADILFGRVSPSGRLPVTFYRSVDDLPPFEEYSMENRTYRYFKGSPLYRFGHGLSYSTFGYSDRKMEGDTLSVKVRNTGNMQAKEVVQVYEITDSIKLVGYRKVRLDPGGEATVQFKVENPQAKFHVGGGMP